MPKTIDLDIPTDAAERVRRAEAAAGQPAAQLALLLTTARLMRAHLADHMSTPNVNEMDLSDDWNDINDALAPFDPLDTAPVNSVA